VRILLFERNAEDAARIREMLACGADTDFEVVHAGEIDEAMEHLAHASFDVIIMDLGPPHGDGLLELRRMLARAGRAPVLILTSIENEPAAAMAMEAGAGEYIFKCQLDPAMIAGAIRFLSSRPNPAPSKPSAPSAHA